MNISKSNELFVSLPNPHVFKCEVNNRPLMAIIKGEYKEAGYFGYQINFSDGFKGTFIAGENGWRSEKDGKRYLNSIQHELNKFVASQLNMFIDIYLNKKALISLKRSTLALSSTESKNM